MGAGDVNNDGHPDLVFGSPFAPEGGEQRGFVAALISSKSNYGELIKDLNKVSYEHKLAPRATYGALKMPKDTVDLEIFARTKFLLIFANWLPREFTKFSLIKSHYKLYRLHGLTLEFKSLLIIRK